LIQSHPVDRAEFVITFGPFYWFEETRLCC